MYRPLVGQATGFSDNNVMPQSAVSQSIAHTTAPLATVDVDLLVVPWFEDDSPSAVAGLDRAVGGELARALTTKEFAARPYDLFGANVIDGTWKPRRVLFVGAGRVAAFTTAAARRVATAGALAARNRRVARLGFLLRPGLANPAGDFDLAGFMQSVTEGVTLAEFSAGIYKTGDQPPSPPATTVIVPPLDDTSPESQPRIEAALRRGRLLGESSNLARELANEPGNALTPREFASRAASIASAGGASVEILDEQQIEALGMGLLLGVARGSNEPPRLIVFRHEPPGAAPGPVLGLVGKGITFDTGGISIKPADGMERMKDDMAGGAAVACAMRAIAMLGAPIRVIGVVPATENMPGGTRDQAGRRPPERGRQDRRGHQHRRRRPADSRRRPVVRAQARRDAPRRRRDPDRRDRRRAWEESRAAFSARPTRGSSTSVGSPIARATACGRCRSSTSTPSS